MIFNQNSRIINWLLPSVPEILCGIGVTLLTLTMSNSNFLRQALYIPRDRNPAAGSINYLTDVLTNIMGQERAASLAVVLFWGLLGIVIYVVILVVTHYMSGLRDAVSSSKLLYPSGSDKNLYLKNFILRNLIQAAMFILFIICCKLTLVTLLPRWSDHYQQLGASAQQTTNLIPILISLTQQLLIWHGLVVLLRSVRLRTRSF